jgi:hypothetical protein
MDRLDKRRQKGPSSPNHKQQPVFNLSLGTHQESGSKALSLAAKQIQEDFLREYCYAPVLLETFVDTEKYQGISYKAANWIYLGQTKGSGRSGRKKDILSRKLIFVYPLQDDFKECLKGEKPYKVVAPQ